MTKGGQFMTATVAALMAFAGMAGKAGAAQCGNGPGGFAAWKQQFANEARARGISASTVAALLATNYSTATINADRGQHGFGSARLQLSCSPCLAKLYVAFARAAGTDLAA